MPVSAAYQPATGYASQSYAPGNLNASGQLVVKNGVTVLQQQMGENRFGQPQYTYSPYYGTSLNKAAITQPQNPTYTLTDPATIAALANPAAVPMVGPSAAAQGALATAPMGGVPDFLAAYLKANGPGQVTQNYGGYTAPAGSMVPATNIGGGSSMPTSGGNGFLSTLQALKSGGAPVGK